jgi:hypothetical protein
MASTEGPSFDRSAPVSMDRSRIRSRRDVWFPRRSDYTSETKPFYLTSEFVVFVLYVMGLGVSASTDATIDSRLFWILTTVATAAYMLSRGIAKAATRSRAYDPREDIDLGKD